MEVKLENKYGNIHINEEVLASIASIATMECYGVVGMANKSAGSGLAELLRRESSGKGVKIHAEGDEAMIDIFVIIEFGTRISAVAENIIDKVKYNIESITGIKVKNVNINVKGVRVEK